MRAQAAPGSWSGRIRPAVALALGLALALAAGCDPAGPDDAEPAVTLVAASELPATPAAGLVYRYRFASANADSLLRRLRAAGVPLREAWQPIEDLCMDPLGPRFTVLLSRPFPRIAALDFEPGSGIRACTVRVRRYHWGG